MSKQTTAVVDNVQGVLDDTADSIFDRRDDVIPTGNTSDTMSAIVVCFDGTGQSEARKHPTNVQKVIGYLDLDKQFAVYCRGIGAESLGVEDLRGLFRFGRLELFARGMGTPLVDTLAGVIGAGADARVRLVKEAIAPHLNKQVPLYIFGYSRGAAMARMLANELYVDAKAEGRTPPRIAFLGLWDTVPAFGVASDIRLYGIDVPFQRINLKKDFTLHDNVASALHIVATDEQRPEFDMLSLNKFLDRKSIDDSWEEVWFPGIHSDIGGGAARDVLADVSLEYMLRRASAEELQFKIDVSTLKQGLDSNADASPQAKRENKGSSNAAVVLELEERDFAWHYGRAALRARIKPKAHDAIKGRQAETISASPLNSALVAQNRFVS